MGPAFFPQEEISLGKSFALRRGDIFINFVLVKMTA